MKITDDSTYLTSVNGWYVFDAANEVDLSETHNLHRPSSTRYGTYSKGGKNYTVKTMRKLWHHYKNNPWFDNDNSSGTSSKKLVDRIFINLEIVNCQFTVENYTGYPNFLPWSND